MTIYKVSGNCEFIKKFKPYEEEVDETGGANRITVYIALSRRESKQLNRVREFLLKKI